MKRVVNKILAHPACTLLALYYTIIIMVPNMALCVTESMGWLPALVNIVTPLGFYMLVISMFRRTGWAVIAMTPFSVLAAFQIVLLFLYGGSIIAVDMFLNVVTTNMSEASELLENLGPAIVAVVVLYLPPIIWAVVSLVRRKEFKPVPRRVYMRGGVILFLLGVVLAIVAGKVDSRYSVTRDLFPVNVIYNIKVAVDRTVQTERYAQTSAGFRFDSCSSHCDSVPEVYVLVIGETSRAINWQLGGYERPTNPHLSRRDGITFFTHALSESNTTHKSVPMLLSHVSAAQFDSIGSVKSIIQAFNEAGFATTFISNQAPNRSYTEFFGHEADNEYYMADTLGRHRWDGEMLPYVARCLADTCHTRQFIVLHSYGSHFRYQDRYPDGWGSFQPDRCAEVTPKTRPELVNAYDNSIEYTDMWLDQLVGMLENSGRRAALVYSADHGEDILDDRRGRFLHASPTPTYYQLHVAMFTWVSPRFSADFPVECDCLHEHRDTPVSSTSSVFNTMLQLGGIETVYRDDTMSLASASYRHREPLYLNDMNCGVVLEESGLKKLDFDRLDALHLLGNSQLTDIAKVVQN